MYNVSRLSLAWKTVPCPSNVSVRKPIVLGLFYVLGHVGLCYTTHYKSWRTQSFLLNTSALLFNWFAFNISGWGLYHIQNFWSIEYFSVHVCKYYTTCHNFSVMSTIFPTSKKCPGLLWLLLRYWIEARCVALTSSCIREFCQFETCLVKPQRNEEFPDTTNKMGKEGVHWGILIPYIATMAAEGRHILEEM